MFVGEAVSLRERQLIPAPLPPEFLFRFQEEESPEDSPVIGGLGCVNTGAVI